MNKELAWDRNSLSQADTVGGVHPLLDKDMIRESINKMKNGKATELSSVVLEMVTAVWESSVYMITDLVSQITVEDIPAEW